MTMRIECSRCHEVVDAVLTRAGADHVVFTCGACGGDTRAAVLAAPPAAVVTDGPRCPKCDAPRGGAAACPRCGLAPVHAERWQRRATIPPTATLGAAWAACEAAWTDDAVHERAATVALASRDFAWLASRYRDVLRLRPDDAIAQRRLDTLARRAQATLTATAAAPTAAPPKRRFPVLAVVVAAIAVAVTVAYASHLSRQREARTGRRRPVEPVAPYRPSLSPPGPAIEPAPGQR